MAFKWKSGFPAPKGVSADKAGLAIKALGEGAKPEDLVEASKKSDHVFHDDLWSEDDSVWAQRARLQRARSIMNSVVSEMKIGGRVYETRAYEFVRGGYRSIEAIAKDQDLVGELINEVAEALGVLQGKLFRLNQLRKKD